MTHTSSVGEEVSLTDGEPVGLGVGSFVVTMTGTVGMFVEGSFVVDGASVVLVTVVGASVGRNDGLGVVTTGLPTTGHSWRLHPSSWHTRSLSVSDLDGGWQQHVSSSMMPHVVVVSEDDGIGVGASVVLVVVGAFVVGRNDGLGVTTGLSITGHS